MTVLEMDGASRDFGTRHLRVTALDRVSLRVSAGELVAVMGPSGSGPPRTWPWPWSWMASGPGQP
jgi:putative ABC transport system ATP-binding protein